MVQSWLRFHIPLIEPDVRIARIRLSDKSSRLHPRHVVPKPAQAYEPEVPVKVRKWIGPASKPDLHAASTIVDHHAELAHDLLGLWNSDDNGEDHHIHGERAQPWAEHLHRQYWLQQHDQQPREYDPRRDTGRQSEAIQTFGDCFAHCRRHRQRRWHICGRQFGRSDRHAQRHPQLCQLDTEREGGQHVGELHVHHAQRQYHADGSL